MLSLKGKRTNPLKEVSEKVQDGTIYAEQFLEDWRFNELLKANIR